MERERERGAKVYVLNNARYHIIVRKYINYLSFCLCNIESTDGNIVFIVLLELLMSIDGNYASV